MSDTVYGGRCLSCGDEWKEWTRPEICPECHSLDVVVVSRESDESNRPADEDRAGGRNTMTRKASGDASDN